MRNKNASYKHYSFRMDDASWDDVDYLSANHINMSLVVRKALRKAVERHKMIKKAFPED